MAGNVMGPVLAVLQCGRGDFRLSPALVGCGSTPGARDGLSENLLILRETRFSENSPRITEIGPAAPNSGGTCLTVFLWTSPVVGRVERRAIPRSRCTLVVYRLRFQRYVSPRIRILGESSEKRWSRLRGANTWTELRCVLNTIYRA